MTHGIDTDFLVAVEIRDHAFHKGADGLLERLLDSGHDFAVAPQTLAEFVHVATDPRRMAEPLTMREALGRAEHWWQAREVVRLFADGQSIVEWLLLLREHRLGRGRILDTMLASLLITNKVSRLITNDREHFRVFGCFELISFRT